MERIVEKLGALEFLSWVGLTMIYYPIIKTGGDLINWMKNTLSPRGMAGLLERAGAGDLTLLTEIPIVGGIYERFFGLFGLEEQLKEEGPNPMKVVRDIFWAAVAAALTIVMGKTAIGKVL